MVVFSIDQTLCYDQSEFEVQAGLANVRYPPECARIWWTHGETRQRFLHTFLPHLRILFDYLMERGVRIVFFSTGVTKQKNLWIMPALLKSFWGGEKYKALKTRGQFRVHSRNDLRDGDVTRNEGDFVKDLRKLVRDGESVSNAVLVDHTSVYRAHDQRAFILARTFCADPDFTRLNSVYYVLGLFRTYFEDERYRTLPVRDALAQILPGQLWDVDLGRELTIGYPGEHPFVWKMIDVGLSAVRERMPNATLYR